MDTCLTLDWNVARISLIAVPPEVRTAAKYLHPMGGRRAYISWIRVTGPRRGVGRFGSAFRRVLLRWFFDGFRPRCALLQSGENCGRREAGAAQPSVRAGEHPIILDRSAFRN